MSDTRSDEVIAVTGDHAHACIARGAADGNRDGEDSARICLPGGREDIKALPSLCSTAWKGFERDQDIRGGCLFLIVEVVDG